VGKSVGGVLHTNKDHEVESIQSIITHATHLKIIISYNSMVCVF
jgi:hypothetical protein